MNKSEIIAKLREMADGIESGSRVVTGIEVTTSLNGNYEHIEIDTQAVRKHFEIEDHD